MASHAARYSAFPQADRMIQDKKKTRFGKWIHEALAHFIIFVPEFNMHFTMPSTVSNKQYPDGIVNPAFFSQIAFKILFGV